MDKQYYSEKLDDYLSNSLSETEKRIFEQILQKDPVLRQDLEIKKETVQQLQRMRKAQIKARLSNINVYQGSRHKRTRWIWLTSAAALLLLGIFSVSLMPPIVNKTKLEVTQTSNNIITETQKTTKQATGGVKKEEIQDKAVVKEESPTATTVVVSTDFTQEPVLAKNTITKPAVVQDSQQTETQVEELVFYYPDEEEDAYTFEINAEDELKGVLDGSGELSLDQQYKQNQLRYQHYDEQIFSSTDFEFSPISLTVGRQQKIFVYHEGYFYELLPNQYEQKIATKVHNRTLIDRLRAKMEKNK